MLEGTQNMSGEKIADAIDFEGAWLNARSEDYFTGFELISLNDKTPKLLDLLRQIINEPVFPVEAFEALKAKEVARMQLNYTRTPYWAAWRLSQSMSGHNHPYHSRNTLEELQKISREDIIEAWNQMMSGSSLNIYVGGQPDSRVKNAVRHFAESVATKQHLSVQDNYVPHSSDTPEEIIIEVEGAKQASVAMGLPSIPRSHPDYIPLRMAVVALGGYFGSRLMTNLREKKGLTYGITASLYGIFSDSYISISADCDPTYVDDVIENIKKEIIGLAENPMDEDELNRLKMFLGTMLASTLDSPFAITDNYLIELTLGTPSEYFYLQQESLETLTPEKISQMISKYMLPISRSTIVIARPV